MIARGDGTPLYNFAVAVDDLEMRISDVIRGDDHLSNTPKQLLVLEALGGEPPRYAHLPLLHGPDGKKLSKRHGAASVQELRDAGYLPAALRNYLALLGWGAEDDETILSTEQLIERFDIERVGRSSAIFDERKLRWLNGRYMRELPPDAYVEAAAAALEREGHAEAAADRERLAAACAIAQEKAQTLERALAADRLPLRGAGRRPEGVVEGDGARRRPGGPRVVARGRARRSSPSTPPTLERELGAVVERLGVKPRDVYQPMRVAITGTTVSPGIFESLAALGRERSSARIEAALARLLSACRRNGHPG